MTHGSALHAELHAGLGSLAFLCCNLTKPESSTRSRETYITANARAGPTGGTQFSTSLRETYITANAGEGLNGGFPNEHLTLRETYITANAGEGPNDRNDRAIRVAAAWYAARLPGVRVLVLTNDADNRRRALEAGLQAMTVQARAARARQGPGPAAVADKNVFAKSLTVGVRDVYSVTTRGLHRLSFRSRLWHETQAASCPVLSNPSQMSVCPTCQAYARGRTDCAELADMVAAGASAEGGDGAGAAGGGAAGGKAAKRKRIYEDHRPMSEVTAGIRAGRLHQARSARRTSRACPCR